MTNIAHLTAIKSSDLGNGKYCTLHKKHDKLTHYWK